MKLFTIVDRRSSRYIRVLVRVRFFYNCSFKHPSAPRSDISISADSSCGRRNETKAQKTAIYDYTLRITDGGGMSTYIE